jgi:cytochrome bd-type quinol oxidase subunit 2
MTDQSARTWISVSLIVQGLGYVFDAVWHGLLNPGFEPTTAAEMMRHLLTVHLPLYIGAASLLASTSVALLPHLRRAHAGRALPVAFAGAVVSAGAEAWHAVSHLRLDAHSGPIAGMLSFLGFLVVLVALSLSNRRRRRGRVETEKGRHAA